MSDSALVVVLPGIGGSVLARPGRPEEVVWHAGPGDLARAAAPGRWSLADRLSLAEWPRLEPVGVIRSAKLLGFTVVPGYERLLRDQLPRFGKVDTGDPSAPVPDADVVVVPYDFRRSIVEAAERLDDVVCSRLTGVSAAGRVGRVIVVGHSMGGLVARVWMALLGRWRWCRALVTLGTPHRGAPKALDWLVNGVRMAGRQLPGPTRLVREWPSVVQLLPCYPAVRNLDPSGAVTADALYPHQLPVQWLAGPAWEAFELHRRIESGWREMPRGGPELVPCLGWSHPTPDAGWWDGASLRVGKTVPDWLDLTGWDKDRGDGTVPSVSALPPEMDNHARSLVRVQDRHAPMGSSAVVAELLARYQAHQPPRLVHGAEDGEHPPTIGLDLDELHPQGQPIPLTATLREVHADVSGLPVWATLRPADGQPRADAGGGGPSRLDVQLDWDSPRGCFGGVLPPQPRGLYEVCVSVREVPDAGDLAATDVIAVLGDE